MRLGRLIVFVLFTMVSPLFAQDVLRSTVTVNFQNATVAEFAKDIASKTTSKIYYDPAEMDSLRITFKAENASLSSVLEGAFRGTGFFYAAGKDGAIFLTKAYQLNTALADGYFGIKSTSAQKREAAGVAYVPADKNEKIAEASIENKVYDVGIKTNTVRQGNATLAGYLKDIKTGEPVIGAGISVVNTRFATTSDQFGFYSLTIPTGKHQLLIKGFDIRDARRQIFLYSDGRLNIELHEQIQMLKEVKISADKVNNVRSTELGINKVDVRSLKQVPTVFGEADVLRVVLTLPGVQSVGEASTGFNVRGGSADQNLILLNDATIYNPSHFFGFFSAFNPDIVKEVQLYKSSIPERFGGRLSSVLDVTNREGNKKKFTGSAGIGIITSRLNIEGPIDSNSTSFILGGRTTYSNWLLDLLPESYKNSRASFSDINLGITHQANEKNTFYLSGYYSTDKFKLNADTSYGYSNKNGSLKWKHNFNNKFFGVFTGGADQYDYKIGSNVSPAQAYNLDFSIRQINFKTDFNYSLNTRHTFNFGLSSILYKLEPGNFTRKGSSSTIVPQTVAQEQALESGIYFGDKFDVNSNFSISAGVRYSIFNNLGPCTVFNYVDGVPKSEITQVDSTSYGSSKLINTYHGPELRLSARYSLSNTFSIKAAFNTLRQYIHLLSNTTAIAPTDVWKLSDPNIKPQRGSQVSLGFYKNNNSNTIETSVEVYYKALKDYLDYKSGATLVLNPHIERAVISTAGKAYGVEFFVKKATGKLNGWISYAYSRTFLKMDDPTVGQPVNGGKYYPANYDKPHAVNFTGNYRITHRYSFSLSATYSSGRPITVPAGFFNYAGSQRIYYTERNAFRVPDYFRTDLSVNIDGNHKLDQLAHNSFSIGVYNLTGRQNAYSTYFTSQNGVVNGYKLSIFAAAIPFVNYNIRF